MAWIILGSLVLYLLIGGFVIGIADMDDDQAPFASLLWPLFILFILMDCVTSSSRRLGKFIRSIFSKER